MKAAVSILAAILALLLAACAPMIPAETGERGENTGKETLYVAYMESDLASRQIVESFSSETVELIPVILAEEAFDNYLLRTNFLGDVLLIPGKTQISTAAYTLSGHIKKMDSLLPELTEGAALYPVLDAGIVDGGQYYLPLRFQLPYVLTTQSKLEAFGISLLPEADMEAWMGCIQSSVDMERALILAQPGKDIGAALYDALRLSGVWMADPTVPGAPVSEKLLEAYARYIKTVWEEGEKARGLYNHTHGMHPYPLIDQEEIALIQGQGCLPDVFRIFESTRPHDPVFLACPQYEDAHAVTADITLYAAVTDPERKEAAVTEFLQHAFTTPAGQGALQGLSVSCPAVESYLDTLEQQRKVIYADGPFYQEIAGLSASVRKACEELLGRISSGSIRNAYWERTFSAAMEDFVNGKTSYEVCFERLKSRLYLSAEEMELSVFEIKLPELLMQEIDREEAFSSYSDRYPMYEKKWSCFEGGKYQFEEKSYYGIFDGNVVYRPFSQSALCVETHYKLGDVEISYGQDFDILVYRSGVFFDLQEAWQRGYISQENAAVIARRLEDFEVVRNQ